MTARPDAVAVFLDEEELGQMFLDWPEEMRLAVCLDEDGGGAMLVHHRDEEDRIMARAAEALKRPEGSFSVVPARPGLPTRRMLFSEERRLMTLVAETEDLTEFAADYALNYSFATEEGLDVEAVVTGKASRSAARAQELAQPDEAQAAPSPRPEPETTGHAARRLRLSLSAQPTHAADTAPGHSRHGEATHPPGLPEGFRVLAPDEQRYSLFADAVLSLGEPGKVQLTVGTPDANDAWQPIPEIYFRNDLLSFAIPIATFAGSGRLPARMSFEEAQLPSAMVAALARSPQVARLTAAGEHLFVGLSPVWPAEAPPSRPAARRVARRRRLTARLLRGGLGGGAIAVAVLLALQLGLSPAFSRTDSSSAKPSLRDAIFAPLKP